LIVYLTASFIKNFYMNDWQSRLDNVHSDDYTSVFVSIFYDETESTFLEAAHQVKVLYSTCVPSKQIIIDSFNQSNLDHHFNIIGSKTWEKYIFHYIGHGTSLLRSRWPTLRLEIEGVMKYFCPDKVLLLPNNQHKTLIIVDCCNYLPGVHHTAVTTRRQANGIKNLINFKQDSIICSSKAELCNYYYHGISTLFTQALIMACTDDDDNINSFLQIVNNNLFQLYKEESLFLDRNGQIIDSTINFNY
jgi:hypothetical protein